MKKCFTIFLFFFSVGTLSAQNLNFSDTISIKTFLCSKTWIRYYINPDSTVSDSVMDSLKFYANGSFYKSVSPKNDTVYNSIGRSDILIGKWHFGVTGKVSPKDTAIDYITINEQTPIGKEGFFLIFFVLIDGHSLKGKGYIKWCGNLKKPFIAMSYSVTGIDCNMRSIWREPKQFKEVKKRKSSRK